MARQARNYSCTGIYHVMLRGIDKRLIFLDEWDKKKFIKCLAKARELAGFSLFGYCLMDNHVHLLIREKEEIGTSIKRIAVGYVQWHNNRHGRVGHLFSNRYLSEAVESEKYLLTVLRYIHQNPVKAGMVKRAEDYPWSSYCEYINISAGKETIIETDLVFSCLGNLDAFTSFMNETNNDECMEYKTVHKCTDMQLKNWIDKHYGIEAILAKPSKDRAMDIQEIYRQTGASIRQLSRVLGVGKTIVGKAVKEDG